MLLLDASVWIAAALPTDSGHEAALSLIRKPPRPLAAIDLTSYEIANAVGVRDQQPASARNLCRVVQLRCAGRIATLDIDLLELTLRAASEQRLTAYDAAYVAAARKNGWQLVSLDIADLVSKDLAITPDAALYP
jgi:predicted nucleic acid-binding protein